LAQRPADDSEIGNVSADAPALLAEVEELRRRLAALEERLPRSAVADPPKRRQAIRQPRPQSKTETAEREPDTAARLARRRALGLGALASLFAFIGRSTARAADALTIEPDGATIYAKYINFGNRFGALLRLWDPGYEFGIQPATVYARSDKNFAWYKGGTYLQQELAPGGDGTTMMSLSDGNLAVSGNVTAGGQFVGKGTATLEKNVTVTGDAALSKTLTGSLLTVTAPGDPNNLNKVSHLRLIRGNSDKTGGKKVYLELYQDDPSNDVAEVYPSIRFHHNNKFWHRLEARGDGLHLKTGDINSDAYQTLTVGNLAANGNLTVSALSVPGGAESLRMLRGIINSDGTKFGGGEGFAVKPVAANRGLYDITFTPPFPSVPAATATQIFGFASTGNAPATSEGGKTTDNAVITHLSADRMRVKTGDGNGNESARVFSFIVIGPR